MKRLFQLLLVLILVPLIQACSDVNFKSKKSATGPGPTSCEPNCPPGTSYTWFESGFNTCSKPCGGGVQTQTVECRRTSDNVVVADNLCTGAKPASSRACNVQACTSTYTWNIGTYSDCSVLCGGGVRTRTVICQDQNGATVADSNCSQPKPETQIVCNTTACPTFTYSWYVIAGTCTKQCGGGTQTDQVMCKRNDGSIVADSFCDAGTRPPTTFACNTQACPIAYTYAWEPSAWSTCSKECGDGVQSRSIACKRNDGAYVPENYCTAPKPSAQQACKIKDCPTTPTGRKVTQTTTVTPALNSVDVILIIDDSSSMKADQTKLAQRMSGLVADLDALKIDYQVCLTTTDISYYKGGPIKWSGTNSYIMTKDTPNKGTVFTTTIDALGAQWSSDEQGIKAMYLMIKDFRGSGCLREKATLTTILVSDENERSVGGNQSWSQAQYQPLTPENYPDALINYVKSTFNSTGFVKPFIYNSIIVKPGDTACEAAQDAQTSPSFFGTFYAEISGKTNGHIGSICDNDYSNSLKIIKDRTVNSMPGLTLECTPIDTPVVTFDKPTTTTITVTGNQMKFSPALPEGLKITAVYTCPN